MILMEDIKSFSDKELFCRLKEMGYDIGPVMRTTRNVYEKKLFRALNGCGEDGLSHGDVLGISESDSNDDDSNYIIMEPNVKASGDFIESTSHFLDEAINGEQDNELLDGAWMNPSLSQVDGESNDIEETEQIIEKDSIYEKNTRKINEEIEYYLRKYGSGNDSNFDVESFDSQMDNSELRRRPLHGFRDIHKTYPATFTSLSSVIIGTDEETVDLDVDSTKLLKRSYDLDCPKSRTSLKSIVKGDSVMELPISNRMSNVFKSPLIVAGLILLILILFVLLSVEPEQEIPKTDLTNK